MRATFCILTLSIVLTGCGLGTDKAPREALVVQADGLPSTDASLSELLNWAEQTLTGRCMVGAGFSYYVHGWREDKSVDPPPNFDYGNDNAVWASQNGYGIGLARPAVSDPNGSDRTADPNATYFRKLSKEQQGSYGLAMQGTGKNPATVPLANGLIVTVPRDGCLARMRTELYGDNERWATVNVLHDNLQAEVRPLVVGDPRYRERLGAWRSCMARHGYDLTDPSASREEVSSRYRTGSREDARAYERAVAVSEATCAATTELVATALELEQKYRADVIARHSAELDEYASMRDAALANAQDLLASVAKKFTTAK